MHADDLAQAVILLADANADVTRMANPTNFSGGEALTYRDMLERLFAVVPPQGAKIVETTLLPGVLDLAGWVSCLESRISTARSRGA